MTRPRGPDGSYNEAAHLKFLEGAHDANPHSENLLRSSIAALTEAIRLNGEYARATSELAYTEVLAAISAWARPQETVQLMTDADLRSQDAVQMEGHHDYTVHWSRAFYLVNTGRPNDFDSGLQSFQRAEELFNTRTDPMDRRSGLLVEYGETLVYSGDPNKIKLGIEKIEKALTPPDWYYWVAAFAYYADKQYAKANEYLNKMKNRPGDPGFLFPALLVRVAIMEELNDAANSVEALLTYFREGRRSLDDLARRNGHELVEDAAERIFWDEFTTWGFKDERVSELSVRWLNSLDAAFTRASTQLVSERFNVERLIPRQ